MATKKKIAVNKSVKVETKVNEDSMVKWTGVAGLGLALASILGSQYFLALAAIALGGISVFRSVRSRNYQFVFLGVAAILIGLNANW